MFVNSLGAVADVQLAIRSKHIEDDVMVVSVVVVVGVVGGCGHVRDIVMTSGCGHVVDIMVVSGCTG